jgi:alpha-mannosidase
MGHAKTFIINHSILHLRGTDIEGRKMSSRNIDGTCYFLGHSHLDAAWLWTFSETIEVFHDTCETILKLMENYSVEMPIPK